MNVECVNLFILKYDKCNQFENECFNADNNILTPIYVHNFIYYMNVTMVNLYLTELRIL